jgi:hypothetical protein
MEIAVMKVLEMWMAAVLVATAARADAGPVVREAAGANPAAIQASVDQFRTDLGGPNNGNAAGTQPGGRREINWDGGGAGDHVLQVEVSFADASRRRTAVKWTVIANTEP